MQHRRTKGVPAGGCRWPGSGGSVGLPTRCDSRECGRVCKEIVAGEETVLRILGGRGPRTANRDGTVAAGASVHVLARHWKGVQHRCDELAQMVRLCWGCELNELARGIPGGLWPAAMLGTMLVQCWGSGIASTEAEARRGLNHTWCAMGEAGAGVVLETWGVGSWRRKGGYVVRRGGGCDGCDGYEAGNTGNDETQTISSQTRKRAHTRRGEAGEAIYGKISATVRLGVPHAKTPKASVWIRTRWRQSGGLGGDSAYLAASILLLSFIIPSPVLSPILAPPSPAVHGRSPVRRQPLSWNRLYDMVGFPKRACAWGSSTYEVGKKRWGDATRLGKRVHMVRGGTAGQGGGTLVPLAQVQKFCNKLEVELTN
ncbi:hypothetical protein FIBSPDRAFT_900483 [Athelia psychrophila]|uniref:Uncharacterized protein n=1 Tax=Athelia psychrophila TaxID=1759441 RepID=A0A165YE78_9AGAM|nr:hypothetical protein FIBSPDRAFT_900483 [Fibularhizoctonia sp. CBS 109695]